MKKIILFFLALCVIFAFFMTSCKKQPKDNSSLVPSESNFVDNVSSSIAKTEQDGSFTFAFDPYVLPQDIKNALGSTALYRRFANAVINRESSVPIPTREDYDNIRFAIGENFPFAFLISGYKYDSANNQMLISYNFEQKHDSKIEEFKKAVQAVYDECVKDSDDDAAAAISIYGWLAGNIEIDFSKFPEKNEAVSSGIADYEGGSSEISENEEEHSYCDMYTTLVEKKGDARSVSAVYNFFLMQLGIEGKTVSAWVENEYHVWNMVNLDSRWYHCDIAMEQKSTDGTGLKFFGMNLQRIKQYITADKICSGEWIWFKDSVPEANSVRFEDFSNVVSWEFNYQRDSIDAFTSDYSRFSFKI